MKSRLRLKAVSGTLGKALLPLLFLPAFCFSEFRTTTPLPQSLLSHTAVVWADRIYVAGGISDTGGLRGNGGFLNNVYYSAVLNADGTMGNWEVAANLPDFLGLGMHSSVAHNGIIYVLGGRNFWGPHDTVYFARISSSGALGNWQMTTPMPRKLMGQAAVVHNGRIYVMGGVVRSVGVTNEVFWAEIQADGTVGAWNTASPLPKSLTGHRAAVVGNNIFVIGGKPTSLIYAPDGGPDPSVSDSVYSAQINADGTLGGWTEKTAFPSGLAFSGAAATDKNIYLAGGFNGTGLTNAVYFAPVDAAGNLGDWDTLDTLPAGLSEPASLINNGYFYVLGGGIEYMDSPQSAVYYLALTSTLRASVNITPNTLNRKSNGKWITGRIEVTEAKASDINQSTVRITAVNGSPITPIYADPKESFLNHIFNGEMRKLMVKFDRQAVQAVMPEGNMTLKVEGSLKDGRVFSGEDTIWAIHVSSRQVVKLMRAGKRNCPDGISVDLPEGSFPGNPELLLTVLKQKDIDPAEKIRRDGAKLEAKLKEVSEPVEFGPHGAQFAAPVTISIPYDPAALAPGAKEDDLRMCYWNDGESKWDQLPSTVDKTAKTVNTQTTHFSVYQVMTGDAQSQWIPPIPPALPTPPSQDAGFSLGQVYAYPNPARGDARPVFHVETGTADGVVIRIYTASGKLAHETRLSGSPNSAAGPVQAYEYQWNDRTPSGVYYYAVTVEKGNVKLKKTGKLAIVR